MSSLEHNTEWPGPEIHKTGPILKERFIVMFTKKALTLMLSAALVLAEIPGFGLQANATTAPLPLQSADTSAQDQQQQLVHENENAAMNRKLGFTILLKYRRTSKWHYLRLINTNTTNSLTGLSRSVGKRPATIKGSRAQNIMEAS
jgi:hypothetical protein